MKILITIAVLLFGCASTKPKCRALRCYTAKGKTTIQIDIDKEQAGRTPYFGKAGNE